MANDDVIIMKREEFISILVYSYLQGVEAVKAAVAGIPLHEKELKTMFELRFSNSQDMTKN